MGTRSLADCAVDALAKIGTIGQDMPDDHPMRHAVRSIKRTAETILSDAMRQAVDLSYQAKQMEKDYDAAMTKEPQA